MTKVLPILPFCLSGPLSPHLRQSETGRSELRLLSVSSDGTLRVFIKRLIVTDSSSCSPLLSIHPSPPPLPLLRRHNSHVSGGFGFRQPLRLYSPVQIPLPHLQRAGQAFSYCLSLNGLKIFFVALHKETRLNAPTAFPLFFFSGENSMKCKLCKITVEQ